jgi:peptidyl-dipeptidase Dcp
MEETFDTPFGVPPFDKIEIEDYLPAYKEAMGVERAEVEAIVSNPETPTFANTIEALEATGRRLGQVSNVFDNMNGSNTNERMQEIANEVAPLLSDHYDDILLNDQLFQRIKAVYEQKDNLELNVEQQTLLDDTYKIFTRNGANLADTQKEELRAINKELSTLTLKFDDNVLAENNTFELVIENEADLAGLTDGVIATAAETATERGHDGKWVFTIHKPSMLPFLTYSERRELRERIYRAYFNKGDHGNELDNNEIVRRMASMRVKRAKLLGYETHAHYMLERRMAKTAENVYDLLDQIWQPALAKAKGEVSEFQAMIDAEGGDFQLQPWDWWYYAEKVRKAKYALDDEELRSYFQLENVRDGAFEVVNKLWGITFEERADIPKYHPDVQVYEVKEADGTHLGLLYVDYYTRASKRGGAWMSSFRKQSKWNGKMITPVIVNVFNYPNPTEDMPSLISLDNVKTLFHELGHGLHGLLSDCTYNSQSGTAVPRDYVELPSQIMENWAVHPEVSKSYARHYETGEPIPDELVEKIRKSSTFNQGFETTELIAASYLDMDWHTLADAEEQNVVEFETNSMNGIGIIPEILPRYRSTYFAHIFAGGYSAGYYSYTWAEVLDADAFQAFKEAGLYDQATAQAYRKYILATGGTEEPMTLYKRFRGSEPKIDAYLQRRGLD